MCAENLYRLHTFFLCTVTIVFLHKEIRLEKSLQSVQGAAQFMKFTSEEVVIIMAHDGKRCFYFEENFAIVYQLVTSNGDVFHLAEVERFKIDL